MITEDTMASLASELEPMTPEELKAFRAEHGLTRPQIAALVGVAAATVRNWEQTGVGSRTMPAPAGLLLRRATKAQIERVKREFPPKRSTALAKRPPADRSADGG